MLLLQSLSSLNYQLRSSYEKNRKGDGKAGTNPEEHLGAAHAGCFSMQLSFMITEAGFKVDDIKTEASVDVQNKGGGFKITEIFLNLRAKIPGITQEKFEEISKKATKKDALFQKHLPLQKSHYLVN